MKQFNKPLNEEMIYECKKCRQIRQEVNLSDIPFKDVKKEFTFMILEFGGGKILYCKTCEEYSYISEIKKY